MPKTFKEYTVFALQNVYLIQKKNRIYAKYVQEIISFGNIIYIAVTIAYLILTSIYMNNSLYIRINTNQNVKYKFQSLT